MKQIILSQNIQIYNEMFVIIYIQYILKRVHKLAWNVFINMKHENILN